MRILFIISALWAYGIFACGDIIAQEISIFDDSASQLVLKEPANRIVSLYPALSNIVDELGMKYKIVGTTKHDPIASHNPNITIVGTHMRPSFEIIVGLTPDLVLQGSSRRDALAIVAALKKRNIPVGLFHPHSFQQLFSTIKRIGTLIGADSQSNQLVKKMESKLLTIQKRYPPPSSRPKVFFEINRTSLLTAGTKNIVNDIIIKAGGENIVKIPKRIVRFNREELIKAQPDIYIIQKGPMNRGASKKFDSPFFKSLPAISKGNVLVVDEFLFSRPGPDSIKAVELLAQFIYDRFTKDAASSKEIKK